VFSAVGILAAPRRVDLVRSWPHPTEHDGLSDALDRLVDEATAELGDPTASIARRVDCRYAGQSHELTVESVDEFAGEHERRNGYARPGHPVEVVAIRAAAWVDAPISVTDLPDPRRTAAEGPTAIAETDCTIWLPEGWAATPGEAGALVLRRTA
jgi:N-methylhydantoinase A/oxoprolinase/acetone carboxylase beta subunit